MASGPFRAAPAGAKTSGQVIQPSTQPCFLAYCVSSRRMCVI
jgi:hypothetical protein